MNDLSHPRDRGGEGCSPEAVSRRTRSAKESFLTSFASGRFLSRLLWESVSALNPQMVHQGIDLVANNTYPTRETSHVD